MIQLLSWSWWFSCGDWGCDFRVEMELVLWVDALSGIKPNELSLVEIEQELKTLIAIATSIIDGSSIEHDNQEDYIRMIHLENAKTFQLYGMGDIDD